jgi:hypothetical protein
VVEGPITKNRACVKKAIKANYNGSNMSSCGKLVFVLKKLLNNFFGLYNLKERDNAPKGKEKHHNQCISFFSDL